MNRKQRCVNRVKELCQIYSIKTFTADEFNYHYNKAIKRFPGPHEELLAMDIYNSLSKRKNKSVIAEIMGSEKNEIRSNKGLKI